MKVSAWVSVSDLILIKKTPLEKFIDLVLNGGKGNMFKRRSLDNIFPNLKESGVDGLELLVQYRTTDEDIIKIKKITDSYNLPILSIHQSLNSFHNISFQEIEKLCGIASLFSARVVVLHSNSLRKRIFDQDFIQAIELLQKKYAVTIGIENMPKSYFSIMRKHTWVGSHFTSTLQKSGLAITFDTTHLAQTGGNLADFFLSNKERIVNIHLSDYQKHWLNSRLLLQSRTHLPLGFGSLPVTDFLQLLKEHKYSGLITMEIDSDVDELCESARIIKSSLNG